MAVATLPLTGTEDVPIIQGGLNRRTPLSTMAGNVVPSGGVNIRWFGAKCDGITDDTAAWRAAALVGGLIEYDGDTVLSSVTFALDGTGIRGNKAAKIITKNGSAGSTVLATCNYFSAQSIIFSNLGSPDSTASLWISGDNYSVEDCDFYSQVYDPLTPNIIPGPTQSLFVSKAGSTYAAFKNGKINRVHVEGGYNGIIIQGAKHCQYSNISTKDCFANGFCPGDGCTFYDTQIVGYKGESCGLYAFSTNGPNNTAVNVEAAPIYSSQFMAIKAERCGWGAYFMGSASSDIGHKKYGLDFVATNMNSVRLQGSSYDCAAGGMEAKSTGANGTYAFIQTTNAQTTSGNVLNFASVSSVSLGLLVAGTNIPSDAYVTAIDSTNKTITLSRSVTGTVANGATISFTLNILPAGYNNLTIDWSYTSHLDFSQNGIAIAYAGSTDAAGFVANHDIKIHAVTEQAPAWRSRILRKRWEVCASNGLAWLALYEGTTGQTAPPSGKSHQTVTANGNTMSGSNITVASSSGAVAGMNVWGVGIADGATISSVPDGTHITISADVIGGGVVSGGIIVCADVVDDGGVKWVCMGADGSSSATTNVAAQVTGTKNVKIDVASFNNGYDLQVLPSVGTDLVTDKLMAIVHGRGSNAGVLLSAGGSVTDSTFVLDIEAKTNALLSNADGTNSFSIAGKRARTTGGTTQGAIRVNAGTNTIRIDGDIHVQSEKYALWFDSASINTVTCGSVTFEGGSAGGAVWPVLAQGTSSGNLDWGGSRILNRNAASQPGYKLSGSSTMTFSGRVLRQDMTTAPTTDKGNPGEYMVLATPTTTEWGYTCTSANTWKKMALS